MTINGGLEINNMDERFSSFVTVSEKLDWAAERMMGMQEDTDKGNIGMSRGRRLREIIMLHLHSLDSEE